MDAINVFMNNYAYIFLIGGLSGGCVYLSSKKNIDLFYALLMGSVSAKAVAFICILILGGSWLGWSIASIIGGVIGPTVFNKPNSFKKKRRHRD